MSMPCVTARSPLSAKKSMKTKITPEMKKSTIQSGVGITPTAPWVRSMRAASRADVCSSHLSKADCSLAVSGSTPRTVSKSSTPQGLIASPRVPSSIRSHSWPTTERP